MKYITLLSGSLLLGCQFLIVIPVAAQVRQSWVAQYSTGDTVRDTAKAMAVDAAGNVYVIGNVPNTNTIHRFSEYQTMKFGNDGQLRWAVRYRAATNGNNYAAALRLDAAGNCYVTGSSQTNFTEATTIETATVKYDSEGRQVWVARHATRHENYPNGLALDGAGNTYVTGSSGGSAACLTAKINPAGNVQWTREFIGPRNNGIGYAVLADRGGNVFVTGWASAVADYIADMYTLKYNPDGTLLWSLNFEISGQPTWAEKGYALALDAAENVYVAGGGTAGFMTLKYANRGTQLWYAILPSQFSEWEAQHIALDSGGNIIVAGLVPSQTEAMQWGVAKYSPGGSNQWSRFSNLAVGQYRDDYLDGMVVDDDGAIYVTGSGATVSNTAYIVTRKYAPDGTELWKMLYKDPVLPYARACGLALDQHKNVIVAGVVSTAFDTNTDVVVIKYEQAQSAARLRMVSFDPSAGARLSLFAQSNATYTIEASANLKDWTNIQALPNPTGTVELTDPPVLGLRQRFYRARSP